MPRCVSYGFAFLNLQMAITGYTAGLSIMSVRPNIIDRYLDRVEVSRPKLQLGPTSATLYNEKAAETPRLFGLFPSNEEWRESICLQTIRIVFHSVPNTHGTSTALADRFVQS